MEEGTRFRLRVAPASLPGNGKGTQMRKCLSSLSTSVRRRSRPLRIRDASWPVVLLVASAWSFATNDEGWGYVGLLVAGLYLAVMASAFRLRRSKEDLAGPEGEE